MHIFRRKKKNTPTARARQARKTQRATIRKTDGKTWWQQLHGRPHLGLIGLIALFIFASIIMNFSASNYYGYQNAGDIFYYTKFHILFFGLGILLAYIAYLIPISFIRKTSPILLGIGALFLIYILPEALFGNTLILSDGTAATSGLQMPFVEALNGAPRWINFGFFNFQPSELAKLALTIYIAAWLTRDRSLTKKNTHDLNAHVSNVIIPFLFLLGGISSMILLQRDFDTTVVLVLTVLTVYFVSGTDRLHSIGSLIIAGSSFIFGIFALFLEGYRRERVQTFVDLFRTGQPSSMAAARDEAFQSFNSLIAFASGGIFGNGYNESTIKQGFLQEAAYTDSIFAIIGDELGFIGSFVVIIGFMYFTSIGLQIATQARDRFSALLAVGMTAMVSIQAFLNIAAVLIIIPFGGMPLPFFTYGGTTTIITLIAIGVLLNISKQANTKRKMQRTTTR